MSASLPNLLAPLPKPEISSTEEYIQSMCSQDDAIGILRNNNIGCFFGGGNIQSIHVDLSKLLHKSKITKSIDLEKHFKWYTPYVSK